ncbi:hypothetical protein N7540_002987 [Penicillium herquei]|nr:hypothetical protein N7540_002987 [Penicillium herquei]
MLQVSGILSTSLFVVEQSQKLRETTLALRHVSNIDSDGFYSWNLVFWLQRSAAMCEEPDAPLDVQFAIVEIFLCMRTGQQGRRGSCANTYSKLKDQNQDSVWHTQR